MIRRLYLLSLVLISIKSFAQTEFNTLKVNLTSLMYADSIAVKNSFESRATGGAGIPSKQYKYYESLMKFSTSEELYELTNHPSAAVRLYAFQGLRSKTETVLFMKALRNHQNETETVFSQMGCMVRVDDPVLENIIEMVNGEFYNILSPDDKKFSDELKARTRK